MWTRLDHPNPAAAVAAAAQRSAGGWFARCVWALLAAMHVWPAIVVLVRVVGEPSVGGFASWLTLVAVLALFVLKAVDVPWLRLRRPVLELLALIVIAGIAHGDVISHAHVPALPAETATAVVAVACVAALAHRRLRRFMHAFAHATTPRMLLSQVGTLARTVWLTPQRAVQCAAPPRAPPPMNI